MDARLIAKLESHLLLGVSERSWGIDGLRLGRVWPDQSLRWCFTDDPFSDLRGGQVFFSWWFDNWEILELMGIEGEEIFHSYNMRKNIKIKINFLHRPFQ